MGPLRWYRSDGFEMVKGKGGKPKPEDNWRILHLMDPWGSTWHAGILTGPRGIDSEGNLSEPPDYTHAYMPHRSREAPIAVMEITSYRLSAVGISHIRNQYDGKHVFPSVGRESLLSQVPHLVKQKKAKDCCASKHRIVLACMILRCYDGEATFLLRRGVQPGDTHAVECFRRTFSDMIVAWESERLSWATHSKLMVTTTPSGKTSRHGHYKLCG